MAEESAFNTKMNFGGNQLIEGKKYTVELTDIIRKDNVVAYNPAFVGKKGLMGKGYDELDEASKKIFDETPAEMWSAKDGKEAKPKPKLVNRLTFQFKEPESGTQFMYDAQFDMSLTDFPSKKLRDFVTRSTGMPIQGDEGFTWGSLFHQGDKFVAIVEKKNNYPRLNVDSIMKAELSSPVIADENSLSDDAKKLIEYIKANLVGQSFQAVTEVFNNNAGGTIVGDETKNAYDRTTAAWAEIRRAGVTYSTDGKTFGF